MQLLRKFNKESFFVLLAFLFPLIFYSGVFFGKSFGFDCATGVMGSYPPYGQILTTPNMYCTSFLDPGAYTWQHPAQWMEVIRQYLSGHLPLWSQNIGIGIPLGANFLSSAYFIVIFPFTIFFYLTKGNLLFLDLFFVFRLMILSLGMYLFLRSFKLDRIISLIGSLALFSSGYFIYIPTISHHNVDMWLPLIAWSINNFYFKKDIKWMGISALFLGLSMLGGMPESSVFILFFVTLYSTFLSLFYLKDNRTKFFIFGGIITAAGLLIGSILYIPGIEYITNSFNQHSGGAVDKFINYRNIFLFILPKLFAGTPFFWSGFSDKLDFNPQVWNYIGSIISFLFVMSLINIKKIFEAIKKNKVNVIYFFFLSLTTVLMLQLYGVVHFFVFESFPGFKEIQFMKYSSTLINFSIITSVVLSIPYLFKYKNKLIFIVYILSLSFLIFLNVHYHEMVKANPYVVKYFGFASNIFFAIIFITIITFFIYKIKNNKIVLLTILILLLGEFYIYSPRLGDKNRRDSFRTPPAVNFLKKLPYSNLRMFALDNILYPNIATIYDLNDIRMLDALWVDRYYLYMKNFYAEPNSFRITGIKEETASQSANIVNNNYFDLLSIKYLFSYNNIKDEVKDNFFVKEILKQNSKVKYVDLSTFSIHKESKTILFEHAPNDIKASLIKPENSQYLFLYPAMSENLFEKKEGDGVKFIAKVFIEGALIDSKEVVVDAANKKSDEKWFTLKLGPFPNKEESYSFSLELITDKIKNSSYDWSGWGGFEWDTDLNKTIDKYKLIYDKEMKIYENNDFIPRLRFIDETLCVKPNPDKEKNFDNVVKLMKNSEKEIRNLAIVESNNCENKKYNPRAGKILNQKFEDQLVTFTYSSTEDQYGVLSDTYYQGWNIYINGKKEIIDPVNLAFRGFKLPKGNNIKVKIVYEPWTVKIGLLVTLISLCGAIYISFKKINKH